MLQKLSAKPYLWYLKVKEDIKKEEGISEFVAAIGLVAIAAAIAIAVSPVGRTIVLNLLNRASQKLNALF